MEDGRPISTYEIFLNSEFVTRVPSRDPYVKDLYCELHVVTAYKNNEYFWRVLGGKMDENSEEKNATVSSLDAQENEESWVDWYYNLCYLIPEFIELSCMVRFFS